MAFLQAHCHLVLRSHSDWGEKEQPFNPQINIEVHKMDGLPYKRTVNFTTHLHLIFTSLAKERRKLRMRNKSSNTWRDWFEMATPVLVLSE